MSKSSSFEDWFFGELEANATQRGDHEGAKSFAEARQQLPAIREELAKKVRDDSWTPKERWVYLATKIQAAKVDPHGHHDLHLGALVATVRDGGHKSDRLALAVTLLSAVDKGNGQTLRIAAKLAEEPLGAHRNSKVYELIAELWKHSGNVPSKRGVREAVHRDRTRWANLPQDSNLKGWDRLWKSTGLVKLLKDGRSDRGAPP